MTREHVTYDPATDTVVITPLAPSAPAPEPEPRPELWTLPSDVDGRPLHCGLYL